jgi:hypothetical protein
MSWQCEELKPNYLTDEPSNSSGIDIGQEVSILICGLKSGETLFAAATGIVDLSVKFAPPNW